MLIDTVDPKGKKGKMKVQALNIKDIDITVGYAGKTTIAVANYQNIQGIGMAVCMEGDKYSETIGLGIAAGRAIKHVGEQMEETWNARSTTKANWKAKHKKGDS